MKLLLVGKTGVFDTLAVACGYLGEININSNPYFGDLNLENSRKLVKAGVDDHDNEVYVVGFRAPEIIPIVNTELQLISHINEQDRLWVLPITVPGEKSTWVLSKLANIPLLGSFFLNWAKSQTLNRLFYLLETGRNLHTEINMDARDKPESAAAKPYIK